MEPSTKTPRRFLTPRLRALLDEHRQPTKCGTRDICNAIAPFEGALAAVREQLATERRLLREIELDAEKHPDLQNKLTLLRLKLKTASAAVEAAATVTERVTDTMEQLDRAIDECRAVAEARDRSEGLF